MRKVCRRATPRACSPQVGNPFLFDYTYKIFDAAVVPGLNIVRKVTCGKLPHLSVIVETFTAVSLPRTGIGAVAVLEIYLLAVTLHISTP